MLKYKLRWVLELIEFNDEVKILVSFFFFFPTQSDIVLLTLEVTKARRMGAILIWKLRLFLLIHNLGRKYRTTIKVVVVVVT